MTAMNHMPAPGIRGLGDNAFCHGVAALLPTASKPRR